MRPRAQFPRTVDTNSRWRSKIPIAAMVTPSAPNSQAM
jgi:hypothetical protein